MHISRLAIRNFRLLESVELALETNTTLVVGRNNSGKTSLTEFFRRLFEEQSPRFRIEDFSLGVHDEFWNAFTLFHDGTEDEDIRKAVPQVTAELTVDYSDNKESLGSLAGFIVDLDPACTTTQINVRYALDARYTRTIFDELEYNKDELFKALKDRVPRCFRATVEAQDPNDPSNSKSIEFSKLRSLIQAGFISAQRTLDDASHPDRAALGKILEALFSAAESETAMPADRKIAEGLQETVANIQEDIDENFNEQLKKLIPAFNLFGYPGLADPKLRTETILQVKQLLVNHTSVGYEGANGVHLPESYNGLGPRNLIFILLKLLEYFRVYASSQPVPGIHLVFIEEPEAHLHPQMQNVFIRKLSELAALFVEQSDHGKPWPAQFVVTTHSSHIANESSFESMRYFLAEAKAKRPSVYETVVRDLRTGLSGESDENRDFLHKYMTLTRCDLLFADDAILIEGPSERLLLPKMIEKFDETQSSSSRGLGSRYLSVVEVGGAYAHKFFKLLTFLKLRTLIITDIDSVDKDRRKCRVSEGIHSSNSCINGWFAQSGKDHFSIGDLLLKDDSDKTSANLFLTYQIPHLPNDACGRSFEEAFMLANPELFKITESEALAREDRVWEETQSLDKTTFALRYAIEEIEWNVPKYVVVGLNWLVASRTHSSESLAKNDKDEQSQRIECTDEES